MSMNQGNAPLPNIAENQGPVPGAVQRRAAALGCRVFEDDGDDDGTSLGPYVLQTAAFGSSYDVWPFGLPLAGIVDALDCLERELDGDPAAWASFGEAWTDVDDDGRVAFVLRRMAAWANGESERGIYLR